MTRHGHSRLGAEAGFTLLEMLVVLALIAIAASIAMPMIGRPSDRLRLQSMVGDFISAVRLTREAAILRNAEASLAVDVDRRTVRSSAGRSFPFAQDVIVKLEFAAPERAADTTGGFRFYPDGSSTGGSVMLSLPGRQAKICIQWLTGEARTC
jgi:general secretion pathway protein H